MPTTVHVTAHQNVPYTYHPLRTICVRTDYMLWWLACSDHMHHLHDMYSQYSHYIQASVWLTINNISSQTFKLCAKVSIRNQLATLSWLYTSVLTAQLWAVRLTVRHNITTIDVCWPSYYEVRTDTHNSRYVDVFLPSGQGVYLFGIWLLSLGELSITE